MTDPMEIKVKPAKTFEEQLEILNSRGLVIEDYEFALQILRRISYYRFSAYTLSFKENDRYYKGVTFDLIYRYYEFDSKLRNLVIEIIEYVEISFRTHIAYFIAHKYGPLGYKDASKFRDEEKHNIFLSELQGLLSKSRDPFVLHHRNKYKGLFPVWVAFEVLMFSTLSKLFKNLLISDQRHIAKEYYGLHYEEISSWLYSLTIVRNRCAHYSRLFNQTLPIKPRFRHVDKNLEIRNNQLFAIIFNLKYLINDYNIWINWVTRLEALIGEYKEVDIRLLGFKEDWYALLSK